MAAALPRLRFGLMRPTYLMQSLAILPFSDET